MQQNSTNFLKRTQKYSTHDACLNELNRSHWKNGFICQKFGHAKSCQLKHRHLYMCDKYSHQISPMDRTVFEYACLPLPKWFVAINVIVVDNSGISAELLSKMIDAAWPPAYQSLSIFHQSCCATVGIFDGLVKMHDAFFGFRKPGRRGSSAECKKPVIFAMYHWENHISFNVAIHEQSNSKQISEFARKISPDSVVRTDAFYLFLVLVESPQANAKVTQSEKVGELLPKVHIVISNFKSFLAGFFHVVSLQSFKKYIGIFFCFNCRFRESPLPYRLQLAAVVHVPSRSFPYLFHQMFFSASRE